jgi:hypothetical protein
LTDTEEETLRSPRQKGEPLIKRNSARDRNVFLDFAESVAPHNWNRHLFAALIEPLNRAPALLIENTSPAPQITND